MKVCMGACVLNGSHYITDIKQTMFFDAKEKICQAEIHSNSCYHEKGAQVISLLLKKNGSISEDDYMALTGHEIGIKLLEENVFAFQFKSRQVTFQSTLMMRCCEEMAHWWKYTGSTVA